jgi:hypothetical protein
MNLSGSDFNENPIVGSMHFYQDGEVGISIIEEHEKVSFSDITSLVFATEFLMYALEKDEWMYEYLQKTKSSLEGFDSDLKKKRFRVIEGGLSEDAADDQ